MSRYTLLMKDGKIFDSDLLVIIYQLFADYYSETECSAGIVYDNKNGKSWDVYH